MEFTQPFLLPKVTAPGTPPSGKGYVYFKSDGKLYIKDDTGTETDLTATSAGGNFSPSSKLLASDTTVGANQSVYVANHLEVQSGIHLTVAAGGSLEIG